jgi:3-hydroxymyristoyl/3-hydroxydecanoyl-(acyl carrier protein) dehydratase
MSMNKLSVSFAAEHPTGDGHFAGNPIIPGALLLAEVSRALEKADGQRFDQVVNAKFQHPVRPGDTVDIAYSPSRQGGINFQCKVSGQLVMSGTLSRHAD